ncbi:hypothetical protein D5S18_18525 [Nocardia panacis]|uniref:Uncharacterized protein n=1 Tax=Nocardia panacis TaxID=2340916 RepID=A0A3A4K8X2_9NOCA|nr:hypothetical protein [Nocardia panacis]RJO74149.1 hypothetical protein D5S18_18525 [Nocardia panacis]
MTAPTPNPHAEPALFEVPDDRAVRHVIETAAELAALPVGAVLIDQWRSAFRKGSGPHGWEQVGDNARGPARIVLPGVVVWQPEAGK